MKHRSTISLWSQTGSQLSGQQQVKAVQSDQRCKHQQARFWSPYFGMYKVILFINYLEKGRTINSKYLIALLVCLKEEIDKKWPQMQKKNMLFYQDNTSCHKSMTTMAKLHELHFELLLHPPYSPPLAPSDYWLFADLKRMVRGKRFGSNEEVILETEVYFEAKDKLFDNKGIKLLEKRCNQCIPLEGVKFCLKVVLLVRPGTYWVMC